MNLIRATPPPKPLHWASSETGICWCGESATEEHAKERNPPGTPLASQREG